MYTLFSTKKKSRARTQARGVFASCFAICFAIRLAEEEEPDADMWLRSTEIFWTAHKGSSSLDGLCTAGGYYLLAGTSASAG